MVELVLTPEEKATISYFDWDDASLGKFVKMLALHVANYPAPETNGMDRAVLGSAALLLISGTHDLGANELNIIMEGVFAGDRIVGDWEILVRRTSDPPPPGAAE